MRRDARRALQDLVGEKAAFAGEFTAHLKLALHIGQDLGQRIARRVDLAQRRKPCIHQLVEKGDVNLFLAGEVVEDIGLGEARGLGDLIERRTAIAMLREYLERSFEDALAIADLDARWLFRGLQFGHAGLRVPGSAPRLGHFRAA